MCWWKDADEHECTIYEDQMSLYQTEGDRLSYISKLSFKLVGHYYCTSIHIVLKGHRILF